MPLLLEANDEAGRRIVKPPARPNTRTMFTARAKDRISDVSKPWKPEDIARALRLAEEGDLSTQSEMFEHMVERDAELSGYMQTRTLAMAGLKWAIMPRDESDLAKEAADKARIVIDGIPNMRGVILKVADGIGKGISASEIDWREDKTISSIRWIHPRRYRFDWEHEIFMIMADDETANKPIPVQRDEFKFIIHRPQLRATHPARGGVLRTVVWAFLFRNYSLKDWVTFSELYGMPLRLGKYPAGAKDSDKEELRQAMEQLGTDAYAVVDQRVLIEYVEATNRGQHPGDAIFRAMGRQMAISILGQDQTNTQNEFGSRAQVVAGGAPIRQDILEADSEDISGTLEQDLLFPIVGWHMDWATAQAVCPVFKLFYEPPVDFKAQAEVDKFLFAEPPLGMGLGKFVTREWFASRYAIELAPEGTPADQLLINPEELEERRQEALEAQQGPPGAPGGGRGLRAIEGGKRAEQGMNAAFALLARQQALLPGGDGELSLEQAEIDAKTEALIPRAAAAMRKLAAPVLAIIATSDSLEEIEQRLAVIYPELDEGEIEKLQRRAWFISKLYGAAVVESRTSGEE